MKDEGLIKGSSAISFSQQINSQSNSQKIKSHEQIETEKEVNYFSKDQILNNKNEISLPILSDLNNNSKTKQKKEKSKNIFFRIFSLCFNYQ